MRAVLMDKLLAEMLLSTKLSAKLQVDQLLWQTADQSGTRLAKNYSRCNPDLNTASCFTASGNSWIHIEVSRGWGVPEEVD